MKQYVPLWRKLVFSFGIRFVKERRMMRINMFFLSIVIYIYTIDIIIISFRFSVFANSPFVFFKECRYFYIFVIDSHISHISPGNRTVIGHASTRLVQSVIVYISMPLSYNKHDGDEG